MNPGIGRSIRRARTEGDFGVRAGASFGVICGSILRATGGTDMTKQLTIPVLAMTAMMILAAPPDAFAGGGGAEFQAVYDTLTDWVEGILGRIIAVVMVVAGVAIGIARQSIAAFGIGIASALGLVNAPTIVDNIVTATIAQSGAAVAQLPAVLAVIDAAAR
jgi:conjugal transfer pilus assembly protein TraA